MKYKTLQALVFAPLFILPVYLLYSSAVKEDTKNNPSIEKIKNSNNNKINMENNFEQIGGQEFKEYLKDSEIVLIDVRTPEELERYGVIRENQKLIVYGSPNFVEDIQKLDKNKKYLIYCWHGNRSEVVRNFMKESGFQWVKDLRGGINVWEG